MDGENGAGRRLLRAAIPALILAIGLVVGGYLMGNGLVRARHADRSVAMKGLAERDVVADRATWTLAYSQTGSDLASLQQAIDANTQSIMKLLAANGFTPDEVQVRGLSVNQYTNSNGVLNITVRQRIQLRTTKVEAAAKAFARQAELVRQGVALEDGSSMVYSFTRLNSIKPEMIAAATRDARAAAEQFAKDSGAQVGAIKAASQGYFSIGARDGDGDGSAGDSPYQKVRVVTTIDFYLD
ncbi:MAG: SIMPL domain-containing protein [Sphingomonas sanxanigenens]|uniref:SIMPL domain-containing protein n=1 Tax=Sphingomonas sanxanigenens TaxID=397260 RepID=A0A2W4ZZP5_9SPHN|nr:MAG: SIMPL domain-containing protein [Sphingomonas sanxanigenens]